MNIVWYCILNDLSYNTKIINLYNRKILVIGGGTLYNYSEFSQKVFSRLYIMPGILYCSINVSALYC